MRAPAVLATSILVFLLAGAARAQEDDGRAVGTSVEMPYLIAPITVNGTLVANAYVSSRIVATSSSATIAIREKLPFIQDAFVRDVNLRPVGRLSAPTTVDVPALEARFLADTRRIVGQSLVAAVQIIRVQASPLRVGSAN